MFLHGKQLHRLILLQIWHKISEVIGYGHLYSVSYYLDYTLGPLHTRDWGPKTIPLQALSLVEKAEPVPVRFTLRLRDPNGVSECKMDVKSTWHQKDHVS